MKTLAFILIISFFLVPTVAAEDFLYQRVRSCTVCSYNVTNGTTVNITNNLTQNITINITNNITNNYTTTSGINGTGTANYLAQWDNSSQLETSILYRNGTSLGVNKNDMDAIFDVESPLVAYAASNWSWSSGIAMVISTGINNYDKQTISFHTDPAGLGDYIMLDLGVGNAEAFNVVYISLSGDVGAIWDVQYSDDNSSWTTTAQADVRNGVSGAGTLTTTWATPAASHRYWRLNNTWASAGGSYHTEIQFSTNNAYDIAAFRTSANTGFTMDNDGDIQFIDVGTPRFTIGNDETDRNVFKISGATLSTNPTVVVDASTQHLFLGDVYVPGGGGSTLEPMVTLGAVPYTDYGYKQNASLAILSGSASVTHPTIAFGWDTSLAYDSYFDCGITSFVVDANGAMRHSLLFWCQRNNSFHAVPQTALRVDQNGVGIGWNGKNGVVPTEALEVYGTALMTPDTSVTVPMIIRGEDGQTAALTQWQNSTGDVLTYIDYQGMFYQNGSQVCTATNALCNQTIPVYNNLSMGDVVAGVSNFSQNNVSIQAYLTWLNNTKLNVSDMRFNESALINGLNNTKLNTSDQRYNDSARIDDLNATKQNNISADSCGAGEAFTAYDNGAFTCTAVGGLGGFVYSDNFDQFLNTTNNVKFNQTNTTSIEWHPDGSFTNATGTYWLNSTGQIRGCQYYNGTHFISNWNMSLTLCN